MNLGDPLKKLSWEHQDALKFARNVEKGLSVDTDLNQVRGYAVNIAENFLDPHFDLEETALISRLDEVQSLHEAVVEVVRQHREFARLKQQLQQAEEGDLRPLLERFMELLKRHVALEENRFFPFIEQSLSSEQLQQAGREIDAGPIVNCSNWPDPYWKPKI